MTQFLLFFWQICLMKQGPARAPVSSNFVIAIVLVYSLCSMVLLSVSSQKFDIFYNVELVLLGLTIQSGCTWLLLAFKSLYSRFRATLVCLLGTNSILVLLLVPVNLLLLIIENEVLYVMIEVLYWMFFLWWITVAGFIMQKAMNISLIQGMSIAFTIELLSLVTSYSLLPSQALTPA